MKRNNKKGFTIVELVVVIAIIAILAAVLIPTFSSLIKRANVSKDNQLVRNLNTALLADKAINGDHKTMQSALDAVADAGFLVDRINKASAKDNEILWDSENDVFCYQNGDNVEYIPSSVEAGKRLLKDDYRLWKIYDSVPALADQTYSIYLAGTNVTGEVTVKVGIDVGNNTGITAITYNSDSEHNVVIRTNGGTLTVNAPKETVKHYGYAKVVNVESIGGASYHEFGNVKQIVVNDGHVVAERTAVILSISAEPAVGKTVSIDVSRKAAVSKEPPEVVVSAEYESRSGDITITGTTPVSESATLLSALDEARKYPADATSVPDTFVLDKDNKTLTLKDEVALLYYGYVLDVQAALAKDGGSYTSIWYGAASDNYHHVKVYLDCDIDFEGAVFDQGMNMIFGEEFDGQNHTIKNARIEDGSHEFVGLFNNINYITVKNLTLDSITVVTNAKNNTSNTENISAGILVGYTAGNGINNVTITNSSVTGAKYTGAVVGSGYADITDCAVIDCTVTGQYKMGGIVGYVAANSDSERLINQNTLTNVSITADNVIDGKTPVVGKVVGNFNADGKCIGNTFTNVTGSDNNIGKIESGKNVTQN